jgi:uncharacterized protein (TIGR02147 family)
MSPFDGRGPPAERRMASDSKPILREIAQGLEVTQYLSHRDYLKAVYDGAKARLESYSYLKLADDLGFSKTNVMRLVIAGQRPLTSKAAERIAKALDLHGPARRYWTTLVKYANERLPAERDNLFRLLMSYRTKSKPAELSPTEAEYFSEWYHPVVREMVALAGFDGDPEWIKGRLAFPLRLEQIKRSLELLEQLGVIERDGERWRRSEGVVATDAEVDSMAIVRYHQKMIEIGRESITQVHEDRRDIRAVTVSVPRSLLPVLKGKIQEWVAEAVALESGAGDAPADDVVQINIQMFPFTK